MTSAVTSQLRVVSALFLLLALANVVGILRVPDRRTVISVASLGCLTRGASMIRDFDRPVVFAAVFPTQA